MLSWQQGDGRADQFWSCSSWCSGDLQWKLDLLLWPKDQETEFPVEACWLSQTQQGQTEQIHPVHISILVTDYLTKMGIKTVPHPPYSPDLDPCDFLLFPKLRGYHYETIEEMKEAVMKVIDTLTQEDFHGNFQKLLEWYNKCIAAGGDYFKED